MHLAVMTYTLARQLKDEKAFDFDAACRLAKDIGTDGMDVVTTYGQKPEDVRRILDKHGIHAACYTFFADLNHADAKGRESGVNTIREGLKAAKALGSDKIMIPTPGKAGQAREVTRRNIIAGLKEAAPSAREAGITLTIENFPGEASPFVTAADLLEAVRDVPGLKLTYDNGNAFSGEEPAASFTRCAAHVVHAHFKDWVEAKDGNKMLNGSSYKPALIGQGVVPQAACVAAMKKAGYQGYVDIEYEGDAIPAADATRKAAVFLGGLMRG
jgi:sugar phosphate isomerase/epimerase